MLVARPATAEDVRKVYSETCSFKARAVDLDGQLAGVIGMTLTRPARGIFCWFSEELRPHLKCLTILRLLKWLEGEIKASPLPVFAIRERGEKRAPHILKRLGFRFWDRIDGEAVYIWGHD